MRTASLLLAGALIACDSNTSPGDPTLIGKVVATQLNTAAGTLPTIHVKAATDETCGIIFTVPENTVVYQRHFDGRVVPSVWTNISVGQTVRVWGGPVAESCPAQSRANSVEIEPVQIGPALGWILISPTLATLARNETLTLEASTDVWSDFTWFSRNPNVATVEWSVHSPHRATVTAGTESGRVDICVDAMPAIRACMQVVVE